MSAAGDPGGGGGGGGRGDSMTVVVSRVQRTLDALQSIANASSAHVQDTIARAVTTEASPITDEYVTQLLAYLLSQDRNAEPVLAHASTLIGILDRESQGKKVDWQNTLRILDQLDSLNIHPNTQWELLAQILMLQPAFPDRPALAALCGVWRHPVWQLQILDGLISLDTATFSFSKAVGVRFVISDKDVAEANDNIRENATRLAGSTWNSQDLIESIIHVAEQSDPNVQAPVTSLLDKAIKSDADLIFIALSRMQQPWSQIHSELIAKMFSMFLAGHSNHQLAFFCMKKIDENMLYNNLCAAYNESTGNLTRAFEVAQELDVLNNLLESPDMFMAMDLAALASRRDQLSLEEWLQAGIDKRKSDFIQAALGFVDAKVKEDLSKQDSQTDQTTVPLSVHSVATFLRVLRSNGDSMSAEEIDFFKAVRNLCLQLHPRLMNLAPGAEGQEPGLHVVTFPQDIHKEVDGYYRQMYEERLPIEDLIQLLQEFKVSENERDRQVFACMVHTLFDEYRCFEMYYPPRELAMTAVVFGSLIQHQLIDYIPLGIAIRYVLDALRSPPDSNMFKFGLQALLRFQDRLPEWPQLGQALLALPNLQQSHPDIARIVQSASNGQAVKGPQPLPVSKPVKAPFSSIHVDPVRGNALARDPDEQTSDKILFIVNNLSPSNLRDKVIEARKLIKPELHQWLSSYLVLQRVSIEPNNHGLYTDFIDGLEAEKLMQHVLHETLAKVKMLLNSEKTVQSTTERTILKNLGSWLGNLTLARNKPIRHRNAALKDLLIEAFDNNRLIVAIPFVCKVLEQCSRSSVFKPPNPWLMAVLRLLVELYQFAELKLNLKFEIEVLCKSLDVDLKEIQGTSILRNRPQELAAKQAAQQRHEEAASQQRQLRSLQQSPQRQQQQARSAQQGMDGLTQDMERASVAQYPDSLTTMLQSLPSFLAFNAGLTLFANNGALKRLVYVAIERAIREIINPVVERSVTIAAISARELITKDFAMESDDKKMRRAAHQMAQNLAGSLALVTCREPLRISMVTHARTLFLANGFTEQTLPEQALVLIMQENLDLACSVVERAAMEKSLQDVDEGLSNAYAARQDHQLRGRGYYWDANALAQSQYASTLPDLLKLKPDGLQPQQLRVYEEFGQVARPVADAIERGSASPPLGQMTESQLAYTDGTGNALDAPQIRSAQDGSAVAAAFTADGAPLTPQQSQDHFVELIGELEVALTQGESRADDIRAMTQAIPLTATQSMNRDEISLMFAQKIVQLLYKSGSELSRNVYIHILERLCEISIKAAKEVTAWLIYAEDERKFNVAVTVGLVRTGLINITEEDAQLAKLMLSRDFKPAIVDFAAKFALTCLREPACATKQQLNNIIGALTRSHQLGRSTPAADDLLTELHVGNLQVKTDVASSQPLREQLAFCFAEWVRLFQHSPNAERSFIEFITQMQRQGILKGEEISSLFFRVCTEVGVDSYIKQKAAGGNFGTGIYQPVDAFSKLIVLMIKYHADPSGSNNNEQAKVHYLTKILSIVVLVLAQSHEELGQHFQQKPFFRFFSSLLHDLGQAETSLHGTYPQALLSISNTLNTLQPSFFPSFAFSWMSLVSHRLFMPRILSVSTDEASKSERWAAFYRLLCSQLRFLGPFVQTGRMQDSGRVLYRGTLRIMLVLLHDYPEFLAVYASSLCNFIPLECVQLRNLILSAYRQFDFPDGLPDVFDQNVRFDRIEQCNVEPTYAEDPSARLDHVDDGTLKTRLVSVLSQPQVDQGTLTSIFDALHQDQNGKDLALLNAIVLQVCFAAMHRNDPSSSIDDVSMLVLQKLFETDSEGKYLAANAMCNHLRYPNRHTAFFSSALLQLYAGTVDCREVILRVLLERMIVNRPHPWGLLYTVFELLKDRQRYPIPNQAPSEIIKLLEHIRMGLGVVPVNETLGKGVIEQGHPQQNGIRDIGPGAVTDG